MSPQPEQQRVHQHTGISRRRALFWLDIRAAPKLVDKSLDTLQPARLPHHVQRCSLTEKAMPPREPDMDAFARVEVTEALDDVSYAASDLMYAGALAVEWLRHGAPP
jgi:hypothetical protein